MSTWESALQVVRAWDGHVRMAVVSGQLSGIEGDPAALLRWMRGASPVWVAALSGTVSGSSAVVAAACQIRVADATLALCDAAGFGLPAAAAADIEVTGRKLDASECLRWGIVSRLCAPGGLTDLVGSMVDAMMEGSHTTTGGLSIT